MKSVLIRTDASVAMGSGHVMRCVTVAECLRDRGCDVIFMMEPLPGNLIEWVKAKGFLVVQNFQPVDVCIIDHYGIDEGWERSIRDDVKKIVVIDDLANRRHDCNMLIDQNMVPNFESRYDTLVPDHCHKLLGPIYLIMRDEFIQARRQAKVRDGRVHNVLVFMGGSDPTNETMKVLNALNGSSFTKVDVVVGASNVMKQDIELLCAEAGYTFYCQIDYMARLMEQADFSFGAGGSTTWERCYVGLPSSSTIVADNQLITTETAANLGAVYNVGWHEEVTVETYRTLIQSLQTERVKWKQMSERGMELTESPRPNPWIDTIMELME
ncbi:UDP-2,4-diacetamido-2,4,6-trideoxy-beta-L-altropyranose hydrolase [Sporosarcina sp. PTS2304]|uniref:UDP-2,4-diacetamido-2,4, 6-trideoxy-beta-L-altropyranose hydrolase n=1 Tax=Sporosarcina sp. PTS2304 TaxID=2283194 RepID=UPI000E0D3CA1|nr:UDP-2,4-diacetamido-2,4,6-trideoxy-beta-L-altropyranose hydrolase [Sporosarcina sp. PTS2304]AXH98456.1 UDP-2,4-diacetamido-2,4,6-trideoxy-beta-L-altropyranose hydrolase [Sporosarcina sp. PTS2304]